MGNKSEQMGKDWGGVAPLLSFPLTYTLVHTEVKMATYLEAKKKIK